MICMVIEHSSKRPKISGSPRWYGTSLFTGARHTHYEQTKAANRVSEGARPPREHRGTGTVAGANDPRRARRTMRLARALAGDAAGGVFLLWHLVFRGSDSPVFP